jgi:hypothetical protein
MSILLEFRARDFYRDAELRRPHLLKRCSRFFKPAQMIPRSLFVISVL